MSRRELMRDIETLDTRLNQRQRRLAGVREQIAGRLRTVHPVWWLGGGLLLGLVAGRRDRRRGTGSSLGLARRGFTALRLVGGLLAPGAGVP